MSGCTRISVDNPHTKPVAFWEWVIAEVQARYPDVIFLSEAFTRPKMMQVLAKAGFTQSYSYFTWRNTAAELREYFEELTRSSMRWYFRPNLFPNTPDILPQFLQTGGRPAFLIRALLATTLSPVYGIYSGFELCENAAVPGKEEYLDSEKYHFKERDWEAPGHIKSVLTRLNAIRKTNRALHQFERLWFCPCSNPQILAYAKQTSGGENTLLIVVNLDPHQFQSGWIEVPLAELGFSAEDKYLVEDLLNDESHVWQGVSNYVALDPTVTPTVTPTAKPGHCFRLRRRLGRQNALDHFA